MRSAGFTLNLKKCEFAQPSVKFVGHIIGSGKQEPERGRIEDLLKVEEPKKKQEGRTKILRSDWILSHVRPQFRTYCQTADRSHP